MKRKPEQRVNSTPPKSEQPLNTPLEPEGAWNFDDLLTDMLDRCLDLLALYEQALSDNVDDAERMRLREIALRASNRLLSDWAEEAMDRLSKDDGLALMRAVEAERQTLAERLKHSLQYVDSAPSDAHPLLSDFDPSSLSGEKLAHFTQTALLRLPRGVRLGIYKRFARKRHLTDLLLLSDDPEPMEVHK